MKKKILAVSAALAILVAAALLAVPGPAQQQSMIVQGTDLASVKAAVLSVGGEITHELRIIKSVGANLTDDQLQKLRGIKGIRKLYENSGVTTSDASQSGCTVTGKTKLKFGVGESVEWEIINTSDVDIHLDSAMFLWPASNEYLKEVKLGHDKIYDTDIYGVSATLDSNDWLVNNDKLKIKKGKHVKVAFKFAKRLKERNRSFQGVLPLLKQSIYPAPDFQYPEQISCPGIIVVPHLNGNS
jgi:hypothetical protein